MISHRLAVLVCACGLLHILGDGLHGAEPPEGKLQIAIIPVLPIDLDNPKVIVRYHNVSKAKFGIVLPWNKHAKTPHPNAAFGAGDETPTLREFDLIAGGVVPEYRHKMHRVFGHTIQSRREYIPPSRHTDLFLDLKSIFKIPKDTDKIEFKLALDKDHEVQVVGNLKVERTNHTSLDSIHMTVQPALPLQLNDPRVVIGYYNFGKSTFLLPLPQPGAETKMFWSLTAMIDRKRVFPFVKRSPEGGYLKWTRFVPLKPGKSVRINIRLKDYFAIPTEWRIIEIRAVDFRLPKKAEKGRESRFMNPEYRDTLTLTRPLKRPTNVPVKVWTQSTELVRWFLAQQQYQLELLRAKDRK